MRITKSDRMSEKLKRNCRTIQRQQPDLYSEPQNIRKMFTYIYTTSQNEIMSCYKIVINFATVLNS